MDATTTATMTVDVTTTALMKTEVTIVGEAEGHTIGLRMIETITGTDSIMNAGRGDVGAGGSLKNVIQRISL